MNDRVLGAVEPNSFAFTKGDRNAERANLPETW